MSHHYMKSGKLQPVVYCTSTKEDFNKIAKLEGSRGRAQFSIVANHFKFIKLLGYTPDSHGKLNWWIVGECPKCFNEELMLPKAFKHALTCKSCNRNQQKWVIKFDNIYARWKRMLARCNNEGNYKYPGWGGRGIKVCQEWHDFHSFQDWELSNAVYPRPFNELLEIHRLDNDGNYSPDNCVLLTKEEHSRIHAYEKHEKGLW